MDMIEFKWWRCLDGYRLDRKGLQSISDRFESYRPLDTAALFSLFADSAHSGEGMLAFCNRFGLLGSSRPDIRPIGKLNYEGVALSLLLEQHRLMRGALALFKRSTPSHFAKAWNTTEQALALVRTELRMGIDGRLRLVLVPPNLFHGMWLQLAQHVCSENDLFRCERCGKPFTVGTGTGRRNTAKCCSNACKVAAFQARKRKENS
jgi:hypothetical protein